LRSKRKVDLAQPFIKVEYLVSIIFNRPIKKLKII
jgi:hypothetical protein